MDAELPFSPDNPWASPGSVPPPPAAPPPPREPAWTGLEALVFILFTIAAVVSISVLAFLIWAIAAHAFGWQVAGRSELQLVAITLLGQTGGMLAGLLLTWIWLARVLEVRFWRAIHWRRLPPETVLAMLVGGFVMMIAVQILGHLLPMPPSVPMDQLFTPHTAWLLLIYGVAIAPFFEEFFFRGLICPSLRATFQAGMSAGELRAWRPMARLLAALAFAAGLFWRWRQGVLHPPVSLAMNLGLAAVVVICVIFLALPDVPISIAGWVVNGMARWRRPELLAILITGLLFGLMHASQLGWAWAAVLILVLVGIVLTVVRAATGSLMSSWIFHCAYNGTLFAAQYISTQGFHHFTQGMH